MADKRTSTVTQGRRRQYLGEMLLQAGLITKEQLDEAIAIHEATGRRLGRILVDMGAVPSADVARSIGEQLGIEFVEPSAQPLNEEVLRLVPLSVARRLQAIPVAKDNGVLTVAMVDPLDIIAVDDLRRLTGLDVRTAITTPEEFQAAVERYPALEATMEQVLEDMPLVQVAPGEEEMSLEVLRRMAEEAPVVRLVSQMLDEAVRQRASDVHIERQQHSLRVRYRVDGLLMTKSQLPTRVHPQIVSRIKILANMDIAERRAPQDGGFGFKSDSKQIDVRVSTIPAIFGEKVVMRLLDRSQANYKLEALGLAPKDQARLLNVIEQPQGIFLVTGPTGSGKTTTLYAVLNRLNREEVNVLTVEDPVEYQIPGINQVQVSGRSKISFASTLRHFLRQDPDIIMVGEVRDEETARVAIQAALTGHLVLSTLHANDALGGITRLLDMGIEPYLIASSLEGVAAQRLVRVLCPQCKEPDHPDLEELRRRFGEIPADATFYRGRGCTFCNYTGYRGRIAIFEVAPIDDEIRHLIVSRAPHHELKNAAEAKGMTGMYQDGLLKAARGITTLSEVVRVIEAERGTQ